MPLFVLQAPLAAVTTSPTSLSAASVQKWTEPASRFRFFFINIIINTTIIIIIERCRPLRVQNGLCYSVIQQR